jgi:hypothetical protein
MKEPKMSNYAYVYNSADSDTDVDMELTSANCDITYNNVANVCAYVTQIPPGATVMFKVPPPGPYGLAVQASPAGTPTGTWSLTGNVEVTANTSTGTIAFKPWKGWTNVPEAERPKVIQAKRPRRHAESDDAPVLQRA